MAEDRAAFLRMAARYAGAVAKLRERRAGGGTRRSARRTAGRRARGSHRVDAGPRAARGGIGRTPRAAARSFARARHSAEDLRRFRGLRGERPETRRDGSGRRVRDCGWNPRPLEILTEALLFGDRARQERRRRRSERDPAKILKELSDLRLGAPVVHEAYGVGRYVGLQTMDVAGYTGEFLVLEYAEGDKLYVPGAGAAPRITLHRRAGRDRAAAQARRRRSGRRRGARRRNAFATSPPSCSICTRAGRRARAHDGSG